MLVPQSLSDRSKYYLGFDAVGDLLHHVLAAVLVAGVFGGGERDKHFVLAILEPSHGEVQLDPPDKGNGKRERRWIWYHRDLLITVDSFV